MACCPKSIIEDVLKKHDKITHVYFVACGGSYAGLYPAKYFLQSEAKDLIIGHYSSNEFCHATPKALGKDSIVITQSFSGTTPETVRAAGIAQEAGAASIAVTYDAESPLAKNGDHVVTYGTTKEANDNGHAKALWLAVEILNQIEGYAHYDAFMASYEKYNEIVPAAKEKFAPTAKAWAEKYGEEKLIYVMGSGPNFGVTYSYAICLLQEMQWIHSNCIHSGEYFHGPFEVTDFDVPFVLVKGIGATRELDERAYNFCSKFSQKLAVIDEAEFDLTGIEPGVQEYVAPLLAGTVVREMIDSLAHERGHALSVRRYMWQMEY